VLLLAATVYGFFTFLLAFNVVHDAGHGALFKSKRINALFLLTLDVFGISSFIWKTTHNEHHYSPNVLHHDSLVDDFKLGRIVPNGKWTPFFRFQVFYIPVLSLFYSVSLFLVSDFFKISRCLRNKDYMPSKKCKEILILVFSKITAVYLTIILPYLYLNLGMVELVLFFLSVHIAPGIMVGFFVAPSHFNTHLEYPSPLEYNSFNHSWSEHQLRTTEDFSTNNTFLNFILGGFNHHVAHHLFPHICHIHYPKITPIVKETAKQFQIPYHESTFIELYAAHLKHLKLLGKRT